MKSLLLAVCLVFCFAATSWATPFLVCDPQTGITQYQLDVNGTIGASFAAQADGSAKVDLAAYANGKYTFKLRCADASGWWSDFSSPFVATKPGTPGGVKIIP